MGDQWTKAHPQIVRNTTRSWDRPRKFDEGIEDKVSTSNFREREEDHTTLFQRQLRMQTYTVEAEDIRTRAQQSYN